jgi:hypothetical protein
MPESTTSGVGGTKVTAKVVLNRYEAQSWSRSFITSRTRDITRRMVTIAQEEAPVKTGRLRANIRPAPFKMTGPFKGEGGIEVDLKAVPYAGYVMYGTKPHVIRARRAPALRFYWPKVGRVVFFKKVNHPGTKANRFLERAMNRAARELR